MAKYYTYNKQNQQEATPDQFTPFLKNLPKFESGKNKGKDKMYVIPTDKSSDTNRFRILPPWSAEGLMAKVKRVHTFVGMKKESYVCSESEEEGSCPFCKAVGKMGRDEKYKADVDEVKSKIRAVFNVVDVTDESLGCLVFSTYSTIYFEIKKIQDSGEYGDIMDIEHGRDIKLMREVHGKGKFTDKIYPAAEKSLLCNPDALDELIDLDTVFPEIDKDGLLRAFKSHPWKVYSPTTNIVVPADSPHESKQETKPAVEAQEEKKNNALSSLEARLKAKQEQLAANK